MVPKRRSEHSLTRSGSHTRPVGDWELRRLGALREAKQYLAAVAAKVRTRVPVTTAAPYGNPPAQLVEALSAIDADADDMVSARCDPRVARVLLPLDGSDSAEAALPVALEFIGPTGELILVTVAAPPARPPAGGYWRDCRQRRERYARRPTHHTTASCSAAATVSKAHCQWHQLPSGCGTRGTCR